MIQTHTMKISHQTGMHDADASIGATTGHVRSAVVRVDHMQTEMVFGSMLPTCRRDPRAVRTPSQISLRYVSRVMMTPTSMISSAMTGLVSRIGDAAQKPLPVRVELGMQLLQLLGCSPPSISS
ncbi:hypothetical protein C492_00240 [Natronococcus jeotgali DSM 18795]|uniref:Uncharacterized protein n=1 Tax=Natronococcus jeotgali DSM 18795 TaxID=1227498 RepID=L9XZG8_9EURY|nr:hypothetical protein C492_00240 [Natronococcus jeotgali DSM 18795]